jgi:OmpA-OmpF porin, OOP family
MPHGKGLSVIAAIVAIAIARSAYAQMPIIAPGPGIFYLGGEGGWTTLDTEAAKATIPVYGIRSDGQTWHDGVNVGARAGYQWDNWRLEEEFRYQQNGAHKLVRSTAHDGGITAAAFMSNVVYDYAPDWVVSPHVGAGIGAIYLTSNLNVPGLGQVITGGGDWVLGYQAIGGVRYMIGATLAFDLDYRYLGTMTPQFRTGANFVDGGQPAPNRKVTSGYDSHSLVASLSLRFGVPQPVVVSPPAAPAPPISDRMVFLVFFDWDKDAITPEGMRIIRQAAEAFRAGASIRMIQVAIQVSGYTDRSGSPGYNQRLSERRANNVAGALARLGVPRSQMAVGGRGDNDNRVPTAAGIREPQNRRVEIILP